MHSVLGQHLHLERDHMGDGTVTFDGPLYSADGTTLWFGQSNDVISSRSPATGP